MQRLQISYHDFPLGLVQRIKLLKAERWIGLVIFLIEFAFEVGAKVLILKIFVLRLWKMPRVHCQFSFSFRFSFRYKKLIALTMIRSTEIKRTWLKFLLLMLIRWIEERIDLAYTNFFKQVLWLFYGTWLWWLLGNFIIEGCFVALLLLDLKVDCLDFLVQLLVGKLVFLKFLVWCQVNICRFLLTVHLNTV